MNPSSLTIIDKDFENKLVSLKQRLKSRMNGKTTEQMSNGQISYSINFGVSLMHIKELAAESNYTTDDCRNLWKTNIREAMLIASICLADEDATPQELLNWSSYIHTPDMAEQVSFFLFYRCTDINELCTKLLTADNKYALSISSFAAGRAIQTKRPISESTIDMILDNIKTRNIIQSDARGLSLFLRQAIRIEQHHNAVQNIATQWEATGDITKQQIAFEVNNEL